MYTDKEILLAAQIAYYDFDPKVIAKLTEQNQGEPPTLQQLLQNDYKTGNDNSIHSKLEKALASAAEGGRDSLEYERAEAAIKRYQDIRNGTLASGWRLADYRNENYTTGMAGCLLDTGNGSAIVGFRGSEDANSEQLFTDWIVSDVGLLNSYETMQQRAVENYMNYIAERFGNQYNNFATSGHSLGGNLSIHGAITAPQSIRNKITQSFSLDGPRYSNEYIMKYLNDIMSLPSGVLQHRGWSVVGGFLWPVPNTQYAWVKVPDRVSGSGFQKHDTFYPEISGDSFVISNEMDDLTKFANAASMGIDLSSILNPGNTSLPLMLADKAIKEYAEKLAKEKAAQNLDEYLKEHEFENEEEIANYLKEKTGEEKPEYLVRGALLRCRCGTHARRMNLLKCHGVYIVEHPVVHEQNCVVGDYNNNIASFGVCESPAPPPSENVSYTKDVVRDASGMEVEPAPGGFVTGHKCDPIIVGMRWMDVHPLTRIVDNGRINGRDRGIANLEDSLMDPKGEASITTLSFLVCQYGGLIEPYNSGQNYESEPGVLDSTGEETPEKTLPDQSASVDPEDKKENSLTINEKTNLFDMPQTSSTPIIPPAQNIQGMRSPDAYAKLIDMFKVETTLRYKKTATNTFCNMFVFDVTSAMDAEIPHFFDANQKPIFSSDYDSKKQDYGTNMFEYNANATIQWMQSSADTIGWNQVSADEAVARANQGFPTVVSWYNPGGIGHVAMVRPQTEGSNDILIAQAGATNFSSGLLEEGFGSKSDLQFWTHD